MNLTQLDGMISDTRRRIDHLSLVSPFRSEVARLKQNQVWLEDQRRKYRGTGNLSIAPVIWGAGIAITGLSALVTWAFKQHRETEAVETKNDLLTQLIDEGYTPEQAARVLGHQDSLFDQTIKRLVVVTAIIGGLIVIWKIK